jgi:HPt (histidine-containing phosphotransfer) domain-containing protein
LAVDDLETIHKTTHASSPASGFIAAMALSDVCRELEAKTKDSMSGADLAGLVEQIRSKFESTKKALAETSPDHPQINDGVVQMSALGQKRTSA